MNTKHIILMACAAFLGAAQANAQGQDLSILTVNTDAKTAAMGNASVAAEGMYLYNNPAAFFATDKTFTADVAASFFLKRLRVLTAPSDFTLLLQVISLLNVMLFLLVSAMLEA